MPSTREGRGTHAEQAGLDGGARKGLDRRNLVSPAAGETSSTGTLWGTTARFLAPGELVDHGGDDGLLGGAWEGHRRR
jgi:hypothetical protein